MSVTSIGRPDPDEPAVRHPKLEALVQAARAEPPVAVTIDADRLHAAWQQQRSRRQRGLLLVAAAAVVALGLASLAPRLWSSAGPGSDEVAARPSSGVAPAEAGPSTTTTTEPGRLAAGIEVRALDGTSAAPRVLDPHRLSLPDGEWSVDSHADVAVVVELPDTALTLLGGHVHVEVAGAVSRVEVVREQATRTDRAAPGDLALADAPPSVEPTSPPQATTPDEAALAPDPSRGEAPSAESLAREAEEQMAAGNRAEAIQTLRRLVTLHPRSSTAQAGLIDLGRLLEASGRTDEARCAYASFLERWPGHALGGDVQRAHRALGDGPECRGLRPRPSR